ncbi:hypothetical protein BDA99DRAFT_602872 [Phascolomyces articulosus]|uniref:NAD(P)-binding protein n=1 Tax=Phascolomyces articulosus TaxID=60185 RepID=A0AAD5K5N9_9FUNG|nr:hypothetical protein BDA99DRAFT_602872 [Phascolomyces articulosus]
MVDTYTSKVAVITGASRGIGYNVAKALVERGSKVVIGDLLDKEGEAAAKEFNDKAGKHVAAYLHTDVTKYNDLIALFALAEKTFGSVDIAILNAGIAGEGAGGLFTPLDDRADMFIHEVNVGGVVKGNKVAMLHMAKKGKGGVIINTASIAGFSAMPSIAAYCATKHAVVGWTRSLVNLHSIANIRVNAVCPYWCETDIIANPGNDVGRRFLEATPKTTMEYVVQAFLKCIEDSDLAGETLLVLPDGIHVQENYVPPESCFTPEFLEKVPELNEAGEKLAKEKLIQAVKAAKL